MQSTVVHCAVGPCDVQHLGEQVLDIFGNFGQRILLRFPFKTALPAVEPAVFQGHVIDGTFSEGTHAPNGKPERET